MRKRSSKEEPVVEDLPSAPAGSKAGGEQTQEATAGSATGKNPAAVALGRLGGKKGGKARAAALTPEQRREIARKAAQARWERRRGQL